MRKNINLIFIFFLIPSLSNSERHMMNCVSDDYKEMAFYRYMLKDNERTLNIRTMKGNWVNFCKPNSEEYKVSCKFNKIFIKRNSSIKEDSHEKIIYMEIDFHNSKLKKISYMEESKKTEAKSTFYKCKKIKI